jgi:hypothetical protein
MAARTIWKPVPNQPPNQPDANSVPSAIVTTRPALDTVNSFPGDNRDHRQLRHRIATRTRRSTR